MNEKRVKSLVEILKTTIRELEDEVKSNPDFFISGGDCAQYIDTHDYDYSELLNYYNTNDDDGEID